jgi:hypothetical protein
MFSAISRSTARAVHPMFETVQVQFDWPQVFQPRVTNRAYDGPELSASDPAHELAILLGGAADPYERAIQALRDVRHLLPPEGVAIVDAALR